MAANVSRFLVSMVFVAAWRHTESHTTPKPALAPIGQGLSMAGGGVSIKDFPTIKKKGMDC